MSNTQYPTLTSAEPTPGPTPAAFRATPSNAPSSCVDVAGWYDSDGPEYSCRWYELNPSSHCYSHGNSYDNFDYTANTACCACKEVLASSPDTPTPSSDSYPIFSAPTSPPYYIPSYSYDDDYYTNPNGTGAAIAGVLFAVFAICVVIASCVKSAGRVRTPAPATAAHTSSMQQQQRGQQRTNINHNTNNTTQGGTDNDEHDSPSIRMKVLSILLPKQKSIQKEEMVYDTEEHSYRYDAGGSSKTSSTSCGICLDHFAQGDALMMGLCQHVYHHKCCMDWLVAKQNSCPLCREKMFDESTYKIIAETINDDASA